MTDYDDFEDDEKIYDALDDDDDLICDGCDGEGCPLCCPHTFAPGSEECDSCEYYDECLEAI